MEYKNQYTEQRREKLQSQNKISQEKKDELFQIMTGSDNQLRLYNKENPGKQKENLGAINNRKHYDHIINKSLREYHKNNTIQHLSENDETSEYGGLQELIKYVRSYSDTWKNKYLDQRFNRTPKQKKAVESIEKESGQKIKCIVDKKFVGLFRKLQGISYRGGAVLGERVIVDDQKTLEDEAFLRHEAIHCAQQREMGGVGKKGFIKRIVTSGVDLAKKQFLGETSGLDEAADFATDNQITDYETYMNQFTKGYLKTRQPFAYKKYADPKFRQQEFKRIREEEYQYLKDQPPTQENITKLKQMERILSKLENDNEIRVVLIKPDVPHTKKNDPKFQVRTESETNRKIRLPIEHFIQKYGKEENGYSDGVELRLEYQKVRDEIIQKINGNEKQKHTLEKELKSSIHKKGKQGLYEVKRRYIQE